MKKITKIWFAGDLNFGEKDVDPISYEIKPKLYEWNFLHACREMVADRDYIVFLGNIALTEQAKWFEEVKQLPGNKVFLLGNKDRNRHKWYYKWGFSTVVPFNESLILNEGTYGNILLSYIPSSPVVIEGYSNKYLGLAEKHRKTFDVNSCVLNVHAHTRSFGKERHNTFDASVDNINWVPIEMEQVYAKVFN